MTDRIQEIKELVALSAGVSITEVSINDDFEEDLNIDGAEKSRIIAKLEEKYNFEFDEFKTDNFATVSDLVDFVKDNLNEL